jgi:HK97 family phage major capsid protein
MNKTNMAIVAIAALTMSAPRALCGPVRADASAAITSLNAAFAEFKSANDERLKAKVDDVVLTEKIARLDAVIDTMQAAVDTQSKEVAALKLNGAGDAVIGDVQRDPEYVGSFKAHMRRGDVQAALNKGEADEGGYLAPVEWDRTITGKLKETSPIRAHASVITIGTAGFTKVYTDRAVASGWVGEAATRSETGTPGFSALNFVPGELYAEPRATQQMLDDAAIDLEAWLAGEVQGEFSRQENIAFLTGNGADKPHGLLTYITGAANAARHPFGAIGVKNSGAAAALTDSDKLIDLVYDLPTAYRANAKFFMNRLTQGAMRKLKDGDGNYLWTPSYAAGQAATLAGYDVVEVADLADIGANNVPILFGDMAATYLVVDRLGVRVLRDNLTAKPYVKFYTTKRVGGGVQNPEAMRALKIAA